MKAMVIQRSGDPLHLEERPDPRTPGPREIVLRTRACGVCRTDLHLVDGDLPLPRLPLIPGHEIVGIIEALGSKVTHLAIGDRVGVPWVGWTCGECAYCRSGRENLCERAEFTGYQRDGGYAERVTADAGFVFPIPEGYSDQEAAPLLCAGMIGYRALATAGPASRVGFYGFGAAAHLAVQVARQREQQVYAFTRPGDTPGQEFARKLGAAWAGGSDAEPPASLDAAVIFAPVGALVPRALAAVNPGGIVVCAGIHMSDIPSFPYRILWGERQLRSVANLTRRDGEEFLDLAGRTRLRVTVTSFPLAEANAAIARVRDGAIDGAVVLVP